MSFNANKIITSGGGGAVISRKNHYTNKRNIIPLIQKKYKNKYIFDDIGFNYRMNNIQAAVGLAQIELLNFFKKEAIYKKLL